MSDRRLAELFALLDEERQAILTSRYDRLSPLVARKERLLAELNAAGHRPEVLRRVGQEISRNQSVLAAATAGLRDALARLGERRKVAAGFATYGRDGRLNTVKGRKATRLERKA